MEDKEAIQKSIQDEKTNHLIPLLKNVALSNIDDKKLPIFNGVIIYHCSRNVGKITKVEIIEYYYQRNKILI